MNKAITDGLMLTPPPFSGGLTVWSRGDGTPGSDVYEGSGMAAYVSADQDFSGCLEIIKSETVQKLRYMGETPLLPGCYLRITARVKAISGNLPGVRIAAWAGGAGGAHVDGMIETAPAVTLTSYGDVVTISAIVGSGDRTGVDMVWGTGAIYGHFGLDLTGANGGVIRVDDIEIEDITSAFLRDMMNWVDVRDFGAIGDGVTDDHAAFEAADAAANGREVLVSKGTYYLSDHVTFENRARFEGTVVMPADKRLVLTRNFDLPAYIDAFGDEVTGFKKAIHALFSFSDHESLDMCGRRIELDAPIDMREATGDLDSFNTRRVIRNGQFNVISGPDWTTDEVTSTATYANTSPNLLSNVANVAQIQVGSHVSGNGVGREIYVKERNVGAGTLTLSQPLFGAASSQTYTFKRFKYILDFSRFSQFGRVTFADIEFQCSGLASGIMLPPEGLTFNLRDCFVTKPMDRGITSIGGGCQGMLIDGCQFLSNEQSARVQDRTTIALNVNSNDVKLRDNRVVLFAHFAIMGGTGHVICGNHFFHGDSEANGIRNGGLILAGTNMKTTVIGNYIDNCSIEWTNEYEAEPEFANQYYFGGLSITGNIFTATDVAPWFRWIVIKPYGPDHSIQGLTVTGNVFRPLDGNIDRVEGIDTTYADLNKAAYRNIVFDGNSFNAVNQPVSNPVTLKHTEATDASSWLVDFAPYFPFSGRTKSVQGLVPEGKIQAGASTVYDLPYANTGQGADGAQIMLNWSQACRGAVYLTARMDSPI